MTRKWWLGPRIPTQTYPTSILCTFGTRRLVVAYLYSSKFLRLKHLKTSNAQFYGSKQWPTSPNLSSKICLGGFFAFGAASLHRSDVTIEQ